MKQAEHTAIAKIEGFDRLSAPEQEALVRGFAKLERRQQRWVIEYFVDFNATKAAERAQYSRKTANEQGARLLAKVSPMLTPLMRAQQVALAEKVSYSRERWLLEIQRVAFFDPRKLFDTHGNPREIAELDDDAAPAIAGFEFFEEFEGRGENRVKAGYTRKFKLADKLRALELYGKATGFTGDEAARSLTLIQHQTVNTVNVAPAEAYRLMIEGACPQRS